ncbi:MAG TPA: HNH endonuclease signature motif containing protein [Rhizomicrobium sp.]|nr:HNH endonuclease signature motif containing protein [Rhizomicrobium sp.]
MSEQGSSEGRPPIPAEIRRRVLVEAGHRCSIPTCRYIEVDVHHIVPWAQCQAHEYDNLITLCPNCHRRADRGEIDRKSLRLYKINLRFVHDKYSQLEIDTMFELSKMPPNNAIPWLGFMLILLKRALDSGFIGVHTVNSGITMGSIKATPDLVFLTEKGRDFINELGIAEL